MKNIKRSKIKEFLKRFALVEVGVLGFVSGACTLLPFIDLKIWITAFISISTCAAILIWRNTESIHLPEEVVLDEGEKEDGKVFLEVCPPHNMLVAANKHAKEIYGRDAMSLEEVERWWKRNPFVTAVLRSEWGDYLGYFDILPLADEGARLMESGKIKEREIPFEHILTPTEMKDARTLYLAGIAVKGLDNEKGKIRAARLFHGLVLYTRHYYGNTSRKVLALAATSDGERILRGIGARVVCVGVARKDRHDLYEITLTSGLLTKVESRAKRRGTLTKTLFKDIP
jgi:hypothetical protein